MNRLGLVVLTGVSCLVSVRTSAASYEPYSAYPLYTQYRQGAPMPDGWTSSGYRARSGYPRTPNGSSGSPGGYDMTSGYSRTVNGYSRMRPKVPRNMPLSYQAPASFQASQYSYPEGYSGYGGFAVGYVMPPDYMDQPEYIVQPEYMDQPPFILQPSVAAAWQYMQQPYPQQFVMEPDLIPQDRYVEQERQALEGQYVEQGQDARQGVAFQPEEPYAGSVAHPEEIGNSGQQLLAGQGFQRDARKPGVASKPVAPMNADWDQNSVPQPANSGGISLRLEIPGQHEDTGSEATSEQEPQGRPVENLSPSEQKFMSKLRSQLETAATSFSALPDVPPSMSSSTKSTVERPTNLASPSSGSARKPSSLIHKDSNGNPSARILDKNGHVDWQALLGKPKPELSESDEEGSGSSSFRLPRLTMPYIDTI